MEKLLAELDSDQIGQGARAGADIEPFDYDDILSPFKIENLKAGEPGDRIQARFLARFEHGVTVRCVLVGDEVRPEATAVGGRWFSSASFSKAIAERLKRKATHAIADAAKREAKSHAKPSKARVRA
jgi:hypothetical protein